jgi:molybdenum-dependent DNA-binding transcriptional regulator ModE
MGIATEPTISLPAAARRLGISWAVAWRKVLTGQLEGQQVNGRWRVSERSVRRLQPELKGPPAAHGLGRT